MVTARHDPEQERGNQSEAVDVLLRSFARALLDLAIQVRVEMSDRVASLEQSDTRATTTQEARDIHKDVIIRVNRSTQKVGPRRDNGRPRDPDLTRRPRRD